MCGNCVASLQPEIGKRIEAFQDIDIDAFCQHCLQGGAEKKKTADEFLSFIARSVGRVRNLNDLSKVEKSTARLTKRFQGQLFWEQHLVRKRLGVAFKELSNQKHSQPVTEDGMSNSELSAGFFEEAHECLQCAYHPKAMLKVGVAEVLKSFKGECDAPPFLAGYTYITLVAMLLETSDSVTAEALRLGACALASEKRKIPADDVAEHTMRAVAALQKAAELGDAQSRYIVGLACLGLDTVTMFGRTLFAHTFKVDLPNAIHYLISSANSGHANAAVMLMHLLKEVFPPGQLIYVETANGSIQVGTVARDQPSWQQVVVDFPNVQSEAVDIDDTFTHNVIECTEAMVAVVEHHNHSMDDAHPLAPAFFLDEVGMFEKERATVKPSAEKRAGLEQGLATYAVTST